ncbi:MAG: A/G-specific adenine glycosylase [Gammaproteobacteria bacterium]|nr:A/G-specific adenine glycosylase [Gammaproteobacteria bacterium]
MSSLANALLAWWDRHGRRDLPWQRDPTPYRVWVSEVMLQQTQVATVLRYYDRFLAAFPDVRTLADAPLDAVLHAWSGLGYYGRARHLHRAAQRMRDAPGGALPLVFDDLAALPGIGRSTAGAILALSAGPRHAILDGNVKRVLARVHRIEQPLTGSAVLRELWSLAELHTPAGRVAHYTQAIMDLGATLCTRQRPACNRCPLATRCEAHAAGIAAQLPARNARRPRPQREATVLLVHDGSGRVLLEKRPEEGLWGGLWGLPEIATAGAARAWCAQFLGQPPVRLAQRPVQRHAFTHFDLDMTPVELEVLAPPQQAGDGDRWLWYDLHAPARVGLAAPTTHLIRSLL